MEKRINLSDYIKGYYGNVRGGLFKGDDGTRGWYVESTSSISRSHLIALIEMSKDPAIKNKPFPFVPRRKKPVSLTEVKAGLWYGILTWGEYEDRPWVYSGEYTDDPENHRTGSCSAKSVFYISLPRKKTKTERGAVEKKIVVNKEKEKVLKANKSLKFAIRLFKKLSMQEPVIEKCVEQLEEIRGNVDAFIEK